jgi:hypothetical protein
MDLGDSPFFRWPDAKVLYFVDFIDGEYCNHKNIYIKSTTVYVPSLELGLSHPLSRQRVCFSPGTKGEGETKRVKTTSRVSTEFRRHGIPRNFLTSEVISAQFRRNSAKFRGIPRNFAGIAPEITSVFRGMPKCHFRGHPNHKPKFNYV